MESSAKRARIIQSPSKRLRSREEAPAFIWVSGDWESLEINEIGDQHLLNIYSYLDKRVAADGVDSRRLAQGFLDLLVWSLERVREEIDLRGLTLPARTAVVDDES